MLSLKTAKTLSTIATFLSLICSGLLINVPGAVRASIVTFASANSPASTQSALLSSPQLQQTTRRKRALLIGISKYDRKVKGGNSWWNLASQNDVELMAGVLLSQRFQFKPEDIKIISDLPVELNGRLVPPVAPTHKAISETFRSFLIEQTKAGDVAFFYFAGHGSEVADDDTLVPLDYASRENGQNDIRGEEISGLLAELSRQNPANITIAIDSCHSGSAIRGDYDAIRGGARRAPTTLQASRGASESTDDLLTRGLNRSGQVLRNYVFLAAASSGGPAFQNSFCLTNQNDCDCEANRRDCQTHGVFTYALANALNTATPTTTYQDIYERVWNEVTHRRAQLPQIAGDQRDHVVFQDGALPAESYIPVTVNEGGIFLAAGLLQGMTLGSTFALYPAGTKSRTEGKPLAEAKLVKVRTIDSTLAVTNNVSPALLRTATRAFEISHNYESVLKVALKDVNSFGGLPDTLKRLGLVTTVPESNPSWNVLIRTSVQADRDEAIVPANFRGVILQRRDGRAIIAKIADGQEMYERIRVALINEAKRITLTSLNNTDPNIKIELRLIPVDAVWHLEAGHHVIDRVVGDKQAGLRYAKGGHIEFKVDDCYRVEVRNLSKGDVHVTLLYLDVSGQISPAFPLNGTDNLIRSAASPTNKESGWIPVRDLYIFTTEPVGLESMHAIATKEQTDFAPLFDPVLLARGRGRGDSFTDALRQEVELRRTQRGDNAAAQRLETAITSPLGQLFIAAQEGRGMRGQASPPPTWATATVSYMIVR